METINRYKQNIPKNVTTDESIGVSQLGTPVYSNLTIEGDFYEDNNGVDVSFTTMRFDAVLMSVYLPKIVVRTQIQGRTGSVVEYICDDDYSISISGVITSTNRVAPYDDVANLHDILKAPIPLKVSSKYLNNLGITDIVINDYTLPQQQGGMSFQQFQINCSSFISQELRIKDV